jgi:hypothetical protein
MHPVLRTRDADFSISDPRSQIQKRNKKFKYFKEKVCGCVEGYEPGEIILCQDHDHLQPRPSKQIQHTSSR